MLECIVGYNASCHTTPGINRRVMYNVRCTPRPLWKPIIVQVSLVCDMFTNKRVSFAAYDVCVCVCAR